MKAKGAGIQQLNDFQRKGIEQLARDKGITCEYCGSAELRSEGNAHPYIDKHFGIDLWCTNASAHPANDPRIGARHSLILSPEEARAVGIYTNLGER
jgi:hypothetical protein